MKFQVNVTINLEKKRPTEPPPALQDAVRMVKGSMTTAYSDNYGITEVEVGGSKQQPSTITAEYGSLNESDRRRVRHNIADDILKELRLKRTESQVDSILLALETHLEDRALVR